MSNKQSPKSCSCQQCKFGKGTRAGKKEMKCDERAFRHGQNTQTRKAMLNDLEEADISAAPKGNYYD